MSQLYPNHRQHLIDEGFTPEEIAEWTQEGLGSLSEEEAKNRKFLRKINGKWYSSSGIYLPFTNDFGQLRVDKPLVGDEGKSAKYLTPLGTPSQAWIPDGCEAITEGLKDGRAGTVKGGMATGAIAGVSHYRKALKPGCGYTIIFDADGWHNPSVMLNLLLAGKWCKGKVNLLPEIEGQPKAGLVEYFQAGHTADDYRQLLDNGYHPEDLVFEWVKRWEKLPPRRLDAALGACAVFAYHYLKPTQTDKLKKAIQKVTGLSARTIGIAFARKANILKARDEKFGKRQPRPKEKKLTFCQKYLGHARFNELTMSIELGGEPLRDRQLQTLHLAPEIIAAPMEIGKEFLQDAILYFALQNSYHPVREYLDGIPSQSTIEIESVAARYLGVKDRLSNRLLAMALVAAVKRVYEPGCQFDGVPILVGEQGIGKSQFWARLGGDFYSDSLGSLANMKDEYLTLHSAWIHEWGEVDKVTRKREAEELKSFITKRWDDFRPPYGRAIDRHLRQCIITATSNRNDFLKDATGNRRYWIIPVHQRIDLAAVARDRHLIWAAAKQAYLAGYQTWLSDEEMATVNVRAATYREQDPWMEAISNFLEGKEITCNLEIAKQCLELELNRRSVAENRRISDILRSLGWVQDSNPTRHPQYGRVRMWRHTDTPVCQVSVPAESLARQDIKRGWHTDTLNYQKIEHSQEKMQEPAGTPGEKKQPFSPREKTSVSVCQKSETPDQQGVNPDTLKKSVSMPLCVSVPGFQEGEQVGYSRKGKEGIGIYGMYDSSLRKHAIYPLYKSGKQGLSPYWVAEVWRVGA